VDVKEKDLLLIREEIALLSNAWTSGTNGIIFTLYAHYKKEATNENKTRPSRPMGKVVSG